LTSFSIIMGLVHFVPSARFVDGVGRELIWWQGLLRVRVSLGQSLQIVASYDGQGVP
jgi:hypothetical protein